jgi:hypothetical protein
MRCPQVYLSTTLEAKLGKGAEVYLDYTAYALAALPGALIGARLIETRLGRIGTVRMRCARTEYP